MTKLLRCKKCKSIIKGAKYSPIIHKIVTTTYLFKCKCRGYPELTLLANLTEKETIKEVTNHLKRFNDD